ncbi:MAG: hypothetical protein SWE60_19870 [Thermodesulfobacteriota bacterium]|nr:hypothetical protein [Thermodesulfobacteriota bacterium]
MNRIIIMTDNAQGFDPLARIAKALFSECPVVVRKKGQTRDSAGGRRSTGAGRAGRFRQGAATEGGRR